MEFGTGFGSFNIHKPPIQRMPANPLDKSTIVSVYPQIINEIKHTVFPGVFVIPPAPDGDISILVVGSSSWFKELPDNQPHLEIPNSSIQIAQSVIEDWANGLSGCNMNDCMPGLFHVPGSYAKEEIKKKFVAEIAMARVKQDNYWKEVVKIADVLWSRTNGNPLAVSNEARIGAQKLGLKDKPWLQDFYTLEKKACKACGQFINPNFPICQYCHCVVDEAKAKELGLKFADK